MSITSLDSQDIHRITSGQVIVDFQTVLKELIENSIDANSTSLDINFVNYGLESIEVADNGDGIDSKDFEQLCKNHSTSKLSRFEDLNSITTLGFRGEALSSLCSISTLKVTTTTQSPKATTLEFSKTGDLAKKTICSRKKGTTIYITNIFDDLPVRKKDLNKNIKREFAKAISLISNYILISTGVKFNVNNVTKTGKRQNVLKSEGSLKIQDNLLNVFGTNASFGLIPLDITIDLNDQKSRLKVARDLDVDYILKVNGLISKSSFGFGRSVSDRQFWFINKRPVHLNKFTKMVNEVYKTFNHLEYPSFVLNLEINQNFLDLNVTPDKRTILLHNESEVMEEIRLKITDFFDSLDLSVPKNDFQRSVDTFSSFRKEKLKEVDNEQDNDDNYRENDDTENQEQEPEEAEEVEVESIEQEDNVSIYHENKEDDDQESEQDLEEVEEQNSDEDEPEEVLPFKSSLKRPSPEYNKSEAKKARYSQEEESENDDSDELSVQEVSTRPATRTKLQSILNTRRISKVTDLSSFRNGSHSSQTKAKQMPQLDKVTINIDDEEIIHNAYVKNSKLSFTDCHCGKDHPDDYRHSEEEEEEQEEEDNVDENSDDSDEDKTRISKMHSTPQTDYDDVTLVHPEFVNSSKDDIINYQTSAELPEFFGKFSGKEVKLEPKNPGDIELDNIEDQIESEQVLTLTVSKKDFNSMKIIGQFNLGFILVIRDNKDLFIIDQHASDEKYNFEDLQKHTVFESQRLIQPKNIELNTIDELTVMENLDILIKNGFKIKVDEESTPGSKILLESLPISKKTVFQVSDFYELVHLIKENPNNPSVRCSKIRSMFAMRACRKSIMIGQALNLNTMTNVVRHLGTLEKPWNCPHGRPTMRHLMELKQWKPFNEDYTI